MTGADIQSEAGNANQRRDDCPQQPHHRVHEHVFSQKLDFLFKNSINEWNQRSTICVRLSKAFPKSISILKSRNLKKMFILCR